MYAFVDPGVSLPDGAIQQAGRGPGFAPIQTPATVSQSTARSLSITWSGPVDHLLEMLATATGWHVVKNIAPLAMPTVAVWADKQSLSSIVQQINAQMQGIATVILSPATRTIVFGAPHTMNPYPITVPDQPPAIVRQIQQPDLQGFRKTLSVEPVLAQHGQGQAGSCKGGGFTTLGAVLQAILPEGWTVYTKPGVLLGVQVQYQCNQKPWTDVLREAIHKDGLHGAVWWGARDLTLWPAPVHSWGTPQPKPDLQGFQNAQIRKDVPALVTSPKAPDLVSAPPATAAPAPAAFTAPLTPVFTLNRGDLILTGLQKWAKQSGWTVIWQVPEDWQVPNTTSFSGDFQKAVGQVIQALATNGANVHAVFHTANNTVVISGAGGGE